MTGLTKFDQLRTKTNRQVIRIVDDMLDTAIRDARHALLSDQWPAAKESYLKVKRAEAEATRLMRLFGDFRAGEQPELQFKLAQVREMLAASPFGAGLALQEMVGGPRLELGTSCL